MTRIIMLLALLWSATYAVAADDDILPNSPASSGVRIFKGVWNAALNDKKTPRDADATYIAFNAARGGKLGQYDFYYSLEIVPEFYGSFANCHSTPGFVDYLNQLFGIGTGALVLVKADIDYRWTSGTKVSFLSGDSGLIIAGVGPGTTSVQAGNGCLFDTTLRPTFPLLQYGGGGLNDNFDDFSIKFIVVGGKALSVNAVSDTVSLFGEISAATRWASVANGLVGPVSTAVQQTATTFQAAFQKAGTLQNQISSIYTLKAYAPEGADDKIVWW